MQMRNLSVLTYAQGFTHWLYKLPHGESIGAVWNPGYFNQASAIFNLGALLTCVSTTPPAVTQLCVIAIEESFRPHHQSVVLGPLTVLP